MDDRLREFVTVLHVFLVAVCEVIRQFFTEQRIAKGISKQNGRIAIVTGGAAGIGFETTKRLCSYGMHVFIASRCEEEANCAIDAIRKEQPDSLVEWIQLDLASLKSVRFCAKKFKSLNLPLHVLVNNAGVMIQPFTKTEDDVELQFQVNYLGHFLLTLLLLDLLIEAGVPGKSARIVNISSIAHVCESIDLSNLTNRSYGAYSSYANSKMAIILSTYELHRKLMAGGYHVMVNCLHPGVVDTQLYRYNHWALQPFRKLCAVVHGLKNPEEGSETSMYVALSTELEGASGLYFDNCATEKSIPKSYNEDLQHTLWENSLAIASVSKEEDFFSR